MSDPEPITRRQLREQRGPVKAVRAAKAPKPSEAGELRKPGMRARVAKKLFSATALLFAGLLAVGMSVPANAFFTGTDSAASLAGGIDGQTLAVSDEAVEADGSRSGFKVTSYAEQYAQRYGSRGGTYTPTTGSIRWPYPYASPITDGFGPRVSPCAGCSTMHKGIDFTPGQGVPTYTVAAGVVESSVISNGGLGNVVVVNHTIKGQAIQSVYAHLVMNSSPLKAGDKVKVGDLVGLVGSTGSATGPNMHFEIHVNGVPVDPYAWLTSNAN